MQPYNLPLRPQVKGALSAITCGVTRVGAFGRASGLDGFFGCELELQSGEVVSIGADQQDLEFKFEVFPITAKFSGEQKDVEWQEFLLTEPVQIFTLETEDWLDPGIPCEGAIGSNPVMQCQGAPGKAPSHATAVCKYVGGVEFRGNNGAVLTVATLPFPFALYISAFNPSSLFDKNAYVRSCVEVQP